MKKRILFLSSLMLVSSLVGCGKQESKFMLTYGRYLLNEEKASLNEIDYSDLEDRMLKDGKHFGENFLLATYDEGSMCSCWISHFGPTLEKFVKDYHYEVYCIANDKFGSQEDFGIKHYPNKSKPTLALIENGKVGKQFVYNTTADMFDKADALKQELDKYIKAPKIFKVSQEYLDKQLFESNKDKLIAYYGWSSCPDCQYCEPNVLWPFVYKNDVKTTILYYDADPIKADTAVYDEFRTTHFMNEASGSKFGYLNGKVPTFQYWDRGELKDASTYFNDVVTDGVVTSSFYSEERQQYLGYLEGIKTTVLEGLTIPAEDLSAWGGWIKTKAAVYHDPLLNAFLTKYAL